MSVRNSLNSSTSPFANLSRQPSAAESDDEQKKKDEEAKAKKAKADEEQKEKDAAAKKAEDDEQKKKDEEAKAKKAKAEGDDDDMEDEEQDKDARAARRRERARCAAIFSSPYATANLEATAHLAFGTSMPRDAAISLLAAMCAGKSAQAGAAATEPRRDDLRDRMAQVPNPAVGAGAEGTRTAPSMAEQIVPRRQEAPRRGLSNPTLSGGCPPPFP